MISNSCLSKISRIYKQYEELSKCMIGKRLKYILSKKYEDLSEEEKSLVWNLSKEIPDEYLIEVGIEPLSSLRKKYIASVLNADPECFVYCVYVHTNRKNGKVYVGQTKDVKKRFARGGSNYKKNNYFYNAIKKYGWDGFDHEILAYNLNKDEANEMEIYYIKKFDSTNPEKGYNIAPGGNAGVLAESTKNKMKENWEKKSIIEKLVIAKRLSDSNSYWNTYFLKTVNECVNSGEYTRPKLEELMIQFEERMEKEKETQSAKTPRKNRENYKRADVFIPEDFKSQNKELFKRAKYIPMPEKIISEWCNTFIEKFSNFKEFARKIREEKHQIYLNLPLRNKLEYLYGCLGGDYMTPNTAKKTIEAAINSGEVTEEEAKKIHEDVKKMYGREDLDEWK